MSPPKLPCAPGSVKRNIAHLCPQDSSTQRDTAANESRPGEAPRPVSAQQATSAAGVLSPPRTVEQTPHSLPESRLSTLGPSSAVTSETDLLDPNPTDILSGVCGGLEYSLSTSAQLGHDLSQNVPNQTQAFSEWQDTATDPLMDYIFQSVQATSISTANEQLSGWSQPFGKALQNDLQCDQALGWEQFVASFAHTSPSHSSTSSVPADYSGDGLSTSQPLEQQYGGTVAGNVDFRPAVSESSARDYAVEDVQPYNYTYGYALVARHIASQPEHLQKRLSSATASFRPLLHSRLAMYTDEQQVAVEKQFKQAIRAWVPFLEALPLPACLLRRTGQIQASNQKLCAFTGLSPARLRNGRLAIYELLSPQSFVGYWEAYAKGVVPALQSSQRFEVALEVAVRKDQLGLLPSTDGLYSLCTLNCSVSFDPYGLPSTILAIFTPTIKKLLDASVL